MRTRIVPVMVAVAAAFLLSACSGVASEQGADLSSDMIGEGSVTGISVDGTVARDVEAGGAPIMQDQSVIRTANVNIRVEDVGRATRDVHSLVNRRHGLISSEDSQVNGELNYSYITVQVPASELDAFIIDISALGTVDSVSVNAHDATTQVVDLDARIAALQASIDRMLVLLAQAERIDDLLAIETQLSTRQAELDSLTAQRAWLGDQVAMSTVTVNLSPATTLPDVDAAGFLSGLRSGWAAFVSAIAVGVTALGFLLPFAVILLIALLPLLAIALRQSRRRSAARPQGDDEAKDTDMTSATAPR